MYGDNNVRQILQQVIGLQKGSTISIYLFSRCKEEYRLVQFQIKKSPPRGQKLARGDKALLDLGLKLLMLDV